MVSLLSSKLSLYLKDFIKNKGLIIVKHLVLLLNKSRLELCLSLAGHFQWALHHLNATNAFLHGILSEDIYMHQPPRFVDTSYPHHVYKLHKSLYALNRPLMLSSRGFPTMFLG